MTHLLRRIFSRPSDLQQPPAIPDCAAWMMTTAQGPPSPSFPGSTIGDLKTFSLFADLANPDCLTSGQKVHKSYDRGAVEQYKCKRRIRHTRQRSGIQPQPGEQTQPVKHHL